MQVNKESIFFTTLSEDDFDTLFLTNTISFYILNFAALLGLVILVYQIRHTGDDTFLRSECVFLVSFWVSGSVI